ncbi:hypothetical protein [Pseudoxanthomonas putridarboris]|uniref:Metal-dependent hydrolase, beta-lactamase superfamily II n=1 Tax=Pseudoxanthomonas putridarboris TaxID=752605 RepID=A0ABU9IY48_9GAMM
MKTKFPMLSMLFLAALLAANAAAKNSTSDAQAGIVAPEVGKSLPAWSKGELDIHHINTGRGDAVFLLLPDGTSLLSDASGKTVEQAPFSLPTKPDASHPPGTWVARYVQRVLSSRALPERSRRQLDYFMLSHFHGDHMGAIVPDSPLAPNGAYQLSGITEVAEHLHVAKIIDRGWPTYDYPAPIKNPTVDNYRKFLDWQIVRQGLEVERFQPGRNDQIKLLHDAGSYPDFEIRNIYTNGVVWTGKDSGTRSLFPSVRDLAPADYPIENTLSLVFRVSYGKFDYFHGGDLSNNDAETAFDPPAWKNVETPVALAAGAVDAMKANHHGSWDANSIGLLGNLKPRVIVVTSRAEGHPAINAWKHMTSKDVWPGERDIFVTNVAPATAATTYGIEETAKSTQGHVVIRVAAGGASYRVFVLDDDDEEMRVKAVFGPYASN